MITKIQNKTSAKHARSRPYTCHPHSLNPSNNRNSLTPNPVVQFTQSSRIMASIKSAASRYNSLGSNRSSAQSDPSSSTDPASQSASKRLVGGASSSARTRQSPAPQDLAMVMAAKSSQLARVSTKKKDPSLGSMVKKLMGGSKPKTGAGLLIPADFIAEDLKKGARKEPNFAGLHKKLFSKGKKDGGSEKKALTEVKPNTRTLAMVLRSERELLALNKEQESEIEELKLMLDRKNGEVEKLKDLCLKQREEIRSLKSEVLFPDTMNLELEGLLEKQGSELKHAKQLIPTLQRQVTSLTGQLQCLAADLAEVKADKYSARSYEAYIASPKTPTYDQQDATYSLEFSSEDQTTPGSPDDMFLKDFNPCLTPYSKTKSNEFDDLVCESPRIKTSSRNKLQLGHDISLDPYLRKMSKSSDCCQCSKSGSTSARTGCRSDETKSTSGNQMR